MVKDSIATNARSHINIYIPPNRCLFLLKRHLESREWRSK